MEARRVNRNIVRVEMVLKSPVGETASTRKPVTAAVRSHAWQENMKVTSMQA